MREDNLRPLVATYSEDGAFSEALGLTFPAWHDEAACRGSDPNLFYTERGVSQEEAFAICRRCPVRKECLEYALAKPEVYGVWGGYSERARGRMRKVQRVRSRREDQPVRGSREVDTIARGLQERIRNKGAA